MTANSPAPRPDSRPAVLFLHASDELYGSDRMLLTVLDTVVGRVRPIVILPSDTTPGGLSAALRDRGLDVRRYPVPVIRRRYQSPLGIARLGCIALVSTVRLARLARASRVVAVHTNTSAVLIGPVLAALLGVPHIWHIHEIVDHPRWLGRTIGLASRLGRGRVVTVSDAVAERLRADGGRVTDMLRNPAPDVDDPGPPARDDLPVVLMAGRVNGRKGHDVFVQAATLLHEAHVRAAFELAGGPVPGQPEPYDLLRASVRGLDPASEWLRFDGWSDDLDARITRAAIVVLPTTNQEPLNITALEAMARRRPVIASRTGGLVEVVEDGSTGILVPPGDAGALARAIGSLLADRTVADAMGRAGRQRAETMFSRRAYADAWARLYEETIRVVASRPGYPELEEVGACPICGGRRLGTLDARASVRRCVGCGFRFVSPRPTQAAVARGYSLPGSYASWQRESPARERLWRRRFGAVLGGYAPGRLLDVGAGLGTFLWIARAAGWTVEGTEVSEVAIAHCREVYGIDLVAGELQPGRVVGPFDAITMWHVIEHVPDPLATLRTCRSLLRPDGLLILGLPNDAGEAQVVSATVRVARRLLGRAVRPRYEVLRPGVESHLSHFTPRTIARALADSGFDVVSLGVDDAIPSRSAPGRVVFAARRLLTAVTPWNFGAEMLVVARPSRHHPGS